MNFMVLQWRVRSFCPRALAFHSFSMSLSDDTRVRSSVMCCEENCDFVQHSLELLILVCSVITSLRL